MHQGRKSLKQSGGVVADRLPGSTSSACRAPRIQQPPPSGKSSGARDKKSVTREKDHPGSSLQFLLRQPSCPRRTLHCPLCSGSSQQRPVGTSRLANHHDRSAVRSNWPVKTVATARQDAMAVVLYALRVTGERLQPDVSTKSRLEPLGRTWNAAIFLPRANAIFIIVTITLSTRRANLCVPNRHSQ